MVHREISEAVNRDFDDLKVRNPRMYEKLEKEYRRFEQKTNFAVAMSPIGRAERRP
jgi:hypothetical protein